MIPRLYISLPLTQTTVIPLTADQVHYLKNVLRRAVGDPVLLFNGIDGEFRATLSELKKKSGLAVLEDRTREQERVPDLSLLFAPVKRGPLEMIVQKATELGVRSMVPVLTERTTAARLNNDRLQAIAVEAAEQSGRLTVPTVSKAEKLPALISALPEGMHIMFCDEAGDDKAAPWGGDVGRAAPVLDALASLSSAGKWAVLTGPEGGFSVEERSMLRAHPMVVPVTLGPRILRADTAVIAALSLWQAALGDWQSTDSVKEGAIDV